MKFKYLIKPNWFDSNLTWRDDLWKQYMEESKSSGHKEWKTYIDKFLFLCNINDNGKKEKIEIITVIYAIILDCKKYCARYKKFYDIVKEKLYSFNEESNYIYNKMFLDIARELNYEKPIKIYMSEEYVYFDGYFIQVY